MPVVGHIEPFSAMLRVGGAYGEPYTWAAILHYAGPREVEIVGVQKGPSVREWKDAVTVLRGAGVDVIKIRRAMPDGTFRTAVGYSRERPTS